MWSFKLPYFCTLYSVVYVLELSTGVTGQKHVYKNVIEDHFVVALYCIFFVIGLQISLNFLLIYADTKQIWSPLVAFRANELETNPYQWLFKYLLYIRKSFQWNTSVRWRKFPQNAKLFQRIQFLIIKVKFFYWQIMQ